MGENLFFRANDVDKTVFYIRDIDFISGPRVQERLLMEGTRYYYSIDVKKSAISQRLFYLSAADAEIDKERLIVRLTPEQK